VCASEQTGKVGNGIRNHPEGRGRLPALLGEFGRCGTRSLFSCDTLIELQQALREILPALQKPLYPILGKNVAFCCVLEDSDDRIQDLCSKAVAVTEGVERGVILSELRALLHERIEELTVKKEGLCNPRCQY